MSRPDQQDVILSMADCFAHGSKVIYCSSELTTGLRLYTACLEHGVVDRHKLAEKFGKDWLRDNVFGPNEKAANAFAVSIQAQKQQTTISPACLFVPEWGQHDYLSFWEKLIRTRILEVWFNRNWQYSNGCTFEYMAARAAGIPTLDAEGRSLPIDVAGPLVERAIAELGAKGVDTAKLKEHLSFENHHLR